MAMALGLTRMSKQSSTTSCRLTRKRDPTVKAIFLAIVALLLPVSVMVAPSVAGASPATVSSTTHSEIQQAPHAAPTVTARSLRQNGWRSASRPKYICNVQSIPQPGVQCGTIQWFEKTATVSGGGKTSTGTLKIEVETTNGVKTVAECLLGATVALGAAVVTEGTTAVFTVPEFTYDAACASSVVQSWIVGFFTP